METLTKDEITAVVMYLSASAITIRKYMNAFPDNVILKKELEDLKIIINKIKITAIK